jgi:hypothetical protein
VTKPPRSPEILELTSEKAVRWNSGVNNWMTYVTGDIPVGL